MCKPYEVTGKFLDSIFKNPGKTEEEIKTYLKKNCLNFKQTMPFFFLEIGSLGFHWKLEI